MMIPDHVLKYDYNTADGKKCFDPVDQSSIDIKKVKTVSESIIIKNLHETEPFDFVYVVCSAIVTKSDGTKVKLDPSTVHPFTNESRQGSASYGLDVCYQVKSDIGIGEHYKIDGAFLPMNPCEAHSPCHPNTLLLSHTDWHIEC